MSNPIRSTKARAGFLTRISLSNRLNNRFSCLHHTPIQFQSRSIMKKMIIFTSQGMSDPASRLRGYNVAKALSEYGIASQIIMNTYLEVQGNIVKRILYRLRDFLGKIEKVAKSNKQTVVYIQRGIYSFSSNWSLLLCLISKFVFQKKVIYDIDDALFLFEPSSINHLLRFCDTVIVGGHNLLAYAKKYNKRVYLMPTSVNLTNYLIHSNTAKQMINLGFVGSPTTTKHLKPLLEPLETLAKSYPIQLTIISAPSYSDYEPFNSLFEEFKKRGIKINLVPWKLEDEFCQLKSIDIGLDPLMDEGWETPYISKKEWTKYKCGFKIINYMAAGIPTVASNISENIHIIQNGENGFLCDNTRDWIVNLRKLIKDEKSRINMSIKAKKSAEENYSLRKNAEILARIIFE